MSKQGQGRMSLAFFVSRWRRRRWVEPRIDRAYAAWARGDRPDAAAWRARLAGMKAGPLISVLMPVHETNPAWLAAAVQSVRDQFYQKWELLVVDDASQSGGVRDVLARLAGDARIDVQLLAARGGISAATNAALRHAGGDYVTFLDHDDVLAPHALAAVALEIAATPSLDLVFSDEDQLVEGRRAAPYFKPGWNPDLLLSQNMVGHLAVYRRGLVSGLGGLRPGYDGSQDHDLALRAAADLAAARVRHVPRVLYHWRQSAGSVSGATLAQCRDAARRAIGDHLGEAATVAVDAGLPQWPVVRFAVPRPAPKVSIVGGGGALPPMPTQYAPVECVAEAAWASGDILVFLSPGLRPLHADWLAELAAQASRPEIGAAGACLLGPDGTVVQCGYWLDPQRVAVSPGAAAGDPGYRGQHRLARSVAAVSGDCLAVRRAVFVAAGGFSGEAGDFRAVDLCLKLAARGLRCVFTPYARLEYARSPAALDAGAAWMRARWGAALACDPYRNPNLSVAPGGVRLDKTAGRGAPGRFT